jgi:hypothetical protein
MESFGRISASTQAARKRGCVARTEKDKMLAGELYDASRTRTADAGSLADLPSIEP